MSDKRMIIVPVELAKKIDENRGDMNQSEFIEFLINSRFVDKFTDVGAPVYATREELQSFEEDMKKLMKSFLDFFVTFGLELGKPSFTKELEELTGKLQSMEKESDLTSENKRATIRWKS